MDAISNVPTPANERVYSYAPGSAERAALEGRIKELAGASIDLTMTIDGRQRMGGGAPIDVVQPHNKAAVLGRTHDATAQDVQEAIDTALAAAPAWRSLSFDERAAIFLKAAELLSGPWRATLNAATMLGQSKTAQQAEIDAACELIDFLRFNVAYARQLYTDQPMSSPGVWNRMEYRPLEGFVL
ncbi:MAG: 1-pyrroline-5-carboxylate dehydrogenase, partial [Nonomuraea muscovyensis]|nr:1-pyrroline-5-carboxylate dehydrogenase [Nonomuraea muscovyensis]